MLNPVLFRDRPRPVQIILGGVLPAIVGVIAGVMVGVSATGYWVVGGVAAIGGFLSGFEHRDGWGGADRGFFAGLIYGIALLVTHKLIGNGAKVSLGSAPVLLPVVTAIIGMLITAAGEESPASGASARASSSPTNTRAASASRTKRACASR